MTSTQERGPGGTRGGLGEFLGGLGLAGLGLYLLFGRVVVHTGTFFGLFGGFGEGGNIAVVLVPFVISIAVLYGNGGSKLGWGLLALSMLLLVLEVVSSLRMSFKPTSLPIFLAMVACVAVGLGMIARSLREH